MKRTGVSQTGRSGQQASFAGYWLWNVKDMDEAVAWVKRCPNPMPGPSVIEIRPVYTEDDLKPSVR